MDCSTGSLVLEAVADDRPSVPWKALVDERRKVLGAGGLSRVRDRAKALIQRAEQGREGLSMPDGFHGIHELLTSSSFAMGHHLRPAHQDLTTAQDALARRQGRPQADHDDPEAMAVVAARQAAVQHWEEVQHTSRHPLETRSLTLPPFRLADATPQTSAQVASRWHAAGDAIAAWARGYQVPARPHVMPKVRTQVPALAALVDCWGICLRRDTS